MSSSIPEDWPGDGGGRVNTRKVSSVNPFKEENLLLMLRVLNMFFLPLRGVWVLYDDRLIELRNDSMVNC